MNNYFAASATEIQLTANCITLTFADEVNENGTKKLQDSFKVTMPKSVYEQLIDFSYDFLKKHPTEMKDSSETQPKRHAKKKEEK